MPKPNDKTNDVAKTPRFEYQGKQTSSSAAPKQQASTSKNTEVNNKKANINQSTKQSLQHTKNSPKKDVTVKESHTSEELNRLVAACKESLKVDNNINNLPTSKRSNTAKDATSRPMVSNLSCKQAKTTSLKKTNQLQQPKQLDTLVEKRLKLQKHLKRNAEPSEKDLETFKKQAEKTAIEYNQLIKSSRPRVNLIVVGHVDAGKSTLVGHLLYKLGQISGKQMHRFEVDSQRQGKASFKFAWAMDETAEERDRGVTIDLALTQFTTSNRDIVLLDAPGHVDFIPAVISGAAQADAALLVVDATRGEFETGFTSGGQTREHTFLARSLGVRSLVVVVNKMDNVGWNWNRFSDIVEQLKPFLKQVGYNLKDDVQFVVASGLTGENLTERRIDKAKKDSSHPQLEGGVGNWENVPSLLEAIDKIKEPERMIEKPLRVCVTDVFKGMSSGVFLGGKVISGKLEVRQQLILLPPNETCSIKQVEAKDGNTAKVNRAFAGDIVTTVATGIDLNKYYRGCILCDPLIPCQVTNRFQARIIMFQSVSAILIKGAPIEVHMNGTFESGIVRKLISLMNKNTGELIQRKPRCVAKNSSAIIQLRLERVVCCELYEDNKDLGRFMMRSYGKTIAAGLITKIKPPKKAHTKTKMKSK